MNTNTQNQVPPLPEHARERLQAKVREVFGTPRPWEMREPGQHSKEKFRVVRVHGKTVTGQEIAGAVCEICTQRSSRDNFSDAEELANAKLIVRAVNCHEDLVEALRGMLEWARRVKGPNPGPEIRNAHTALEKAGAQ